MRLYIRSDRMSVGSVRYILLGSYLAALVQTEQKMSTTTPQTLKPKDIVKPDDVMTWELAW